MNSEHFYVTLFSNASRTLNPDNTLAAFICHLARPIDLGSNDPWEVGLSEFTCPTLKTGTYQPSVIVIGARNFLIYCDLISLQFVGENLLRGLRTYIAPSTQCQHIFDQIYYMPVQKRIFQDIRIEILTMEGKRYAFNDNKHPTKVV
jgi:hypothetical protein